MSAGYIAVVDYHKGNLLSVEKGLALVGARAVVSDSPSVIREAHAVVIPGVGAFSDAMEFMKASGQGQAIIDSAHHGTPILGICLGMQLMFERGNEHPIPPAPGETAQWVGGLGMFSGEVPRLQAHGVKVPHMGWNAVRYTREALRCPLFDGLDDDTYFYFTHSYVCEPVDEAVVVGRTEHGGEFVSAIWDGARVFGCQFHPEKSAQAGLHVLRNFVRLVEESHS